MKSKKNLNVQLAIIASQKSIDTRYNFWNKEHLVVLPAYGTRCPQARSIIVILAYGTRRPQAQSIVLCFKTSRQWHCSSFWINIHYRQILKKWKSKVVEEYFAFCIHLIHKDCTAITLLSHCCSTMIIWQIFEYATTIFVASRQKTLFFERIFVRDRCCSRDRFNLFVVGRYSGYQLSFTKIMIFVRIYD